MMTMTSVRLPEALQVLVDSRLDTIDRMLLGRVPRADRLAIVKDVEGQIHELLQGRDDADGLDREGVLEVLATLDPPEAYLPEPSESGPVVGPVIRPDAVPGRRRDARLAKASGITGLASLLGVFVLEALVFVLDELAGSEVLTIGGWFATFGLALTGGIAAFALAARAGLRGGWSIVGVVAGGVAAALGLLVPVVLLLLLA